jgi:hypothetical protein
VTVKELEQRVIELERQVKQLSSELTVRKSGPNHDLLATVDKFRGDEDVLAVLREAMKLREADRKKARQRPSAKRKSGK